MSSAFPDSPYFHLNDLLDERDFKLCDHCHRYANSLCSHCRSVYYCGKECQGHEWIQHQGHCKIIKQLTAKYKKSEIAFLECLMNAGGTLIVKQRREEEYQKCVSDLIAYYSCFYVITGSKQAVREALLIAFQYRQRVPNDEYGIDGMLPDLLLRINQDQMAYDIIKWSTLQTIRQTTETGSPLPLFDIYQADRSEGSISDSNNEPLRMNYFHRSIHIFIKLRLYQHFVDLDAFYAFLNCIYDGSTSSSSEKKSNLELFSGKMDILRCIRSFLLDCKNNLPTKMFAHQNKDILLQQVYESIHEGEKLRKTGWEDFVSLIDMNQTDIPTFEGPNNDRIHLHPEDTYVNIVDSFYEWWRRDELIMKFFREYVQNKK